MTSFPFTLPTVSAGFAALTPHARSAAARVASTVAAALEGELGVGCSIEGRALPSAPSQGVGVIEVVVDLGALGEQVVLEVDAVLACRFAALLLGGDTPVTAAREVLAHERAALELVALVAIAASRQDDRVAALAPRLVRQGAAARDCVVVDLTVSCGEIRGEVRARIPRAAAVAMAAATESPDASTLPDVRIAGRLREGTVKLGRDEAESLAPGDVVLLEDAHGALVFDGGAELVGHAGTGVFTVEDRTMQELQAGFPLVLSVEVARVTVALRELAGVGAGSTLPVQIARDGRVTLRSGDVVVGRGELVDVDGVVGVRVTGWEGCR